MAALVAGCSTLGYYGQAIRGQAAVLAAREPVDELIEAPSTSAALRERLDLARHLRTWAEDRLGLPVGGRYDAYVALEDRYVLWNVFATERFDPTPVQWCFPVAGCVTYRGYFDEAAARAEARRLAAEGFDVHVGGVVAYSTLGWFDDPLLSSFLYRPVADLAELLFHELAHGLLYVPGDTDFNESFATFVGREGVRRWLASPTAAARLAESAAADAAGAFGERWQARLERRRLFTDFVLDRRNRIAEALAEARVAGADEAALEQVRRASWTAMEEAWRAVRPAAMAPWDGFFEAPVSLARLNTVADYNRFVPAFSALLARHDGDLTAFYEAAKALGAHEPAVRGRVLAALTAEAGGRPRTADVPVDPPEEAETSDDAGSAQATST